MNIYLYFHFNVELEVATFLLIFVDIYKFNHTFFHTYIEAFTYKHTCILAHRRNGESRTQEPGWEGRENVFLFETKAYNKNELKNHITPRSQI